MFQDDTRSLCSPYSSPLLHLLLPFLLLLFIIFIFLLLPFLHDLLLFSFSSISLCFLLHNLLLFLSLSFCFLSFTLPLHLLLPLLFLLSFSFSFCSLSFTIFSPSSFFPFSFVFTLSFSSFRPFLALFSILYPQRTAVQTGGRYSAGWFACRG